MCLVCRHFVSHALHNVTGPKVVKANKQWRRTNNNPRMFPRHSSNTTMCTKKGEINIKKKCSWITISILISNKTNCCTYIRTPILVEVQILTGHILQAVVWLDDSEIGETLANTNAVLSNSSAKISSNYRGRVFYTFSRSPLSEWVRYIHLPGQGRVIRQIHLSGIPVKLSGILYIYFFNNEKLAWVGNATLD